MRLNLLRQLSVKEQKLEIVRATKRIKLAYRKLCRTGKWNDNSSKELKEKGEVVLWEANK